VGQAVIATVGYACSGEPQEHHVSRVLLVLATHPWLAVLACSDRAVRLIKGGVLMFVVDRIDSRP
jgi:hypothetical protein